MVALPMSENQMESFAFTVIVYLPNESVSVPRPEVLITPTASSGLRALISYTVPLMVTYCAFAFCNRQPDTITSKHTITGSRFLKSVFYAVILKQRWQSTTIAMGINVAFAE